MKIALFAAVCTLICTSCARYDDFALPTENGREGAVHYRWTVSPEPVLNKGGKGSFDAVDALNPSIVVVNNEYRNYYSGFDGKTWHTGLAISRDGRTWTKRGKVLSPDPQTWEGDYIAANGSVLHDGSQYLQWYQGGRLPRIGLATSSDGLTWRKQGQPVLETGPHGSWDERGVADPYVIRVKGWYYLYYLGQDRARRQRLGVARSQDGLQWQKYRGNPILELGEAGKFDDVGLGEPAVWQEQGWYWMLYTARDTKEYRRLGLARSRDGVTWARVTDEPVLAGSYAWNAAVVCDPHIMTQSDPVGVFFGGGDKPEPAENLNGQIGYATLTLSIQP